MHLAPVGQYRVASVNTHPGLYADVGERARVHAIERVGPANWSGVFDQNAFSPRACVPIQLACTHRMRIGGLRLSAVCVLRRRMRPGNNGERGVKQL